MAITVKHKFVSAIPDGDDTSVVRPSNWNDDHQLTGTVPVANGGTGASTLTGYVKGNGTANMTASSTIPSSDVTGLGTMASQNANNVAITGGAIDGTAVGATTASTGAFTTATASTSVSTPILKATTSAGGSLQNTGGTTQLSWGAGGGNNLALSVATNINPANAQVDISPTGTGTVRINPATASAMDNVVIGATTPKAITGTTITANTQFTGSGAGLTNIPNTALTNSAITINGTSTPLGGSINVGTVTSVSGTAPVVSSGGSTPAISMAKATASVDGYLSAADWTTFNNKGSGSVTSVGGTGTVSGISLSGTVTSSGNLTLGGALDLSTPPAIGGTTPNTGAFTTLTATTISNTRINPRVYSTTSTATLAVNSDSYDQAVLTAQAASLAVSAPTGTPVNGQRLTFRFKDNGTAQAISWTVTSGGFRVIGCTLPTTTVISKTVYIGCIYNSNDTFWDVVSVAQQV